MANNTKNYTNVNILLTMSCGLVLTLITLFVVIPLLHIDRIREILFDRGWIPYVVIFMTMWGLSVCLFKLVRLYRQKSILTKEWLIQSFGDQITSEEVETVIKNFYAQADRNNKYLLINRIVQCLRHYKANKDPKQVMDFSRTQANNDAAVIDSSYSLLRVFIWAIPILGFIGTVIGISQAVGGFSDVMNTNAVIVENTAGISKNTASENAVEEGDISVLKNALGGVTSGLGTAFDTTLLALVMSLIVMFPASSLQKAEEDHLVMIDDFINENVISKLKVYKNGHNEDLSKLLVLTLKATCEKLFEQNRQLIPHLSKTILDDLSQLQQKFTASTHQLVENKIAPVLSEAREVINSIPENYEKLTVMKETLHNSSLEIEELLKNVNNHAENMSQLNTSLEQFAHNISSYSDLIVRNKKELDEQIGRVGQFVTNLPILEEKLSLHVEQTADIHQNHEKVMLEFSDNISKINTSLNDVASHLVKTQQEQQNNMSIARHEFGSMLKRFASQFDGEE